MVQLKKTIVFFLIIMLHISAIAQKKRDFAKFVNMFIGTSGKGAISPSVCQPFGMVQPGPDTNPQDTSCYSGYEYSERTVYGFSQTHLSGADFAGACDFPLMPYIGELKHKKEENATMMDEDFEVVKPGYYATLLSASKIKVELSSTKRVAVHRYTFPSKTLKSNILLDINNRGETIESWVEMVNNSEVKGCRKYKNALGEKENIWFFYLKFSEPIEAFQIISKDTIITERVRVEGTDLKVNVVFRNPKAVVAKIALSAVSVDGAFRNLDAEMPDYNFDKVAAQTQEIWNYELSKFDVSEKDEYKNRIFYSAVYRTMLSPNLYMDADGQYRGADNLLHQDKNFEYYTNISLDKTYRTLFPLFNLTLSKDLISNFVRSILMYRENLGHFPGAVFGNQDRGQGPYAVSIILDAFNKNLITIDTNKVYEYIKHAVNEDGDLSNIYTKVGYIDGDLVFNSVNKSLEFSYFDFCVAEFAKKIGRKEDYLFYTKRLQYWKNLFEKETGFLTPRYKGEFFKPLNPYQRMPFYDNNNAFQVLFDIPHDLGGLTHMFNGTKKYKARLDSVFGLDSKNPKIKTIKVVNNSVGFFEAGVPSSMHYPFLYAQLQESHNTTHLVSKILSEIFADTDKGLPNNDAYGNLSAWIIFSALGIYPVNPVGSEYTLFPSWLSKTFFRTQYGYKFLFSTLDITQGNIYSQQVLFNQESYNKPTLKYQDIVIGGKIEHVLGATPNIPKHDKKKSTKEEILFAPKPYFESSQRIFTKKTTIAIKTAQPNSRIYYTLDGSEPNEKSLLYMMPLEIENSTTIKARSYDVLTGKSEVESSFYKRINVDYDVSIVASNQKKEWEQMGQYLTDGILGKSNFRLGGWTGIYGENMELFVDLKYRRFLKLVEINFLQDTNNLVIFPTEVSLYTSMDNKKYTLIKSIPTYVQPTSLKPQIYTTSFDLESSAKYIKVVAKTSGLLPSWHKNMSNQSWLFSDEITIE